MLDIKKIPVNMLEENCYVVSDDTREAVVIDCGALTDDDRRRITDYIEDRRLQVRHHLCTHMHYDHCFGAAFMWETFHVGPEFNRADEPIYKGMGAEIFGPLAQVMKEGLTPAAARYLTEGDDISFGHHTLTVLSTPGHTPGGICFYCVAEKAVFVGDTLFYCSVGRTDFPAGTVKPCARASGTSCLLCRKIPVSILGTGHTLKSDSRRLTIRIYKRKALFRLTSEESNNTNTK